MVLDAMTQFYGDEVEGFFVTGFPRDIVQAQGFEDRVSKNSKNIEIKSTNIFAIKQFMFSFEP